VEPAATPQALGDLFEYKLKEPITIRKNQSAMAPIVHAHISAEKVSLWNESSGGPPWRAVWLTNASGLTLDGGTFTVLEDEAFAGEGLFDTIRPEEKRIVSYAVDLALTSAARGESEAQRVTRVRIAKGVMIQESEMREKKTYTFRNQDASARTVLIEHPVRAGYRLTSALVPAETTPAWHRFRLPIKARETTSLVVEETRPIEASYTVGKINREQVAVFVRDKSISPEIEQALLRIVDARDAVEALKEKDKQLDEELEQIFEDQKRVRENLKALRDSAAEKPLVERYARQLAQQEDRVEALKKEMSELKSRIEAAEQRAEEMAEQLVFDAKL
jgi:hypothetical protein